VKRIQTKAGKKKREDMGGGGVGDGMGERAGGGRGAICAALRRVEGQVRQLTTHLIVDSTEDKICKRTLKYFQVRNRKAEALAENERRRSSGQLTV
jgi:hypothetical protein